MGPELRAAANRIRDGRMTRHVSHRRPCARLRNTRSRRPTARTPPRTPPAFPRSTRCRSRSITALQEVERELGRPRTTVVARPKTSIFSPFFRASSVSGMLAPFFLETLLNPDLTGPERPYVLAHEWAHLSGYAPEDDASFVGLLAALRAGPAAEYSAWLELAFTAVCQLQPVTQKLVLEESRRRTSHDQRAIYRSRDGQSHRDRRSRGVGHLRSDCCDRRASRKACRAIVEWWSCCWARTC